MQNKKPVFHFSRDKRYNGIFDPDREDIELNPDLVSATEMTGAVPAAHREPDDDYPFEGYYPKFK